ncbi:DUF485 domain-containing protein [Streptomyces sp. B5E4]|uniref:DUF485 domain-containing protein n=1 Tax=Streptomyces sp. B5E4 TaxID=3153568 RepID=UPI00325DDB5D
MNNPQGPEGAPPAPPHDPWSDRPDWSGRSDVLPWPDASPWPARTAPTDRREQLYVPAAPAPGWGWDGWEPEPEPEPAPAAPPPPRAAERADSGAHDGDPEADDDVYLAVHAGPEFQRVRSRYRRFVVPAALAFLVWYLSYVVVATVAPELMGRRVAGPVNVALLAGLGQFATTFLLTWAYARHARLHRDPAALDLRWDIAMRTRRPDGSAGAGGNPGQEPGR